MPACYLTSSFHGSSIDVPVAVAIALMIASSGSCCGRCRAGRLVGRGNAHLDRQAAGKHKIEAHDSRSRRRQSDSGSQGGQGNGNRVAKLSSDDQAYVANAVKNAEDDPFKPKSGGDSVGRRPSQDEVRQGFEAKAGKGKAKVSAKSLNPIGPRPKNIARSVERRFLETCRRRGAAEGPKLKAHTIPTPCHVDQEHETETMISPVGRFCHRWFDRPNSAVAGKLPWRGVNFVAQSVWERRQRRPDGISPSHSAAARQSGMPTITESPSSRYATSPRKSHWYRHDAGQVHSRGVDDTGTRALMREDVFGLDAKPLSCGS